MPHNQSTCQPNQDTTFVSASGCPIIQDDTREFSSVVDEIDTVPTLFTQIQTEGVTIFTQYRIDIRYEKMESFLQMPVAAEDPTGQSFNDRVACEFVKVSQPWGRKVISWTAERIGTWPEVPKLPLDQGGEENEVPIRVDVTPAAPETMPGGTELVFRVSGTYFYGLRRPRGPGDDLPTGLPKYYEGNDEDNTLTEAFWEDGIITRDGPG